MITSMKNLADSIYQFVKPREARNVFAIMGDRLGTPDHVPLKRPTRANADGVKVFTVGTFKMKEKLFWRLRIQRPGPDYIHLRAYNPDRCNGFDAEYYAQFEAEKKVRRRVKGSHTVKSMFVQTRKRNESIDLHVYNLAAIAAMGAGLRENLAEWVESARRPIEEEKPEEPSRPASSWAYGWKS